MGSCGSTLPAQSPVDVNPDATDKKTLEKPASGKMKSKARVAPATTTLIRVASASSVNDSAVNSRNSSATSNSSAKTADSGVVDTDESKKDNELEKKGEENKLNDLFVTRSSSGKVRSVDEAEIIDKLRTEGLISRPKSVNSGLSFEISDEPARSRRLPPRLARLESTTEERKSMTEDDIKLKLAKAAERRKKKRDARLAAIPIRPPSRGGPPPDCSLLDLPPINHKPHPETELLVPPKEGEYEATESF